MEINMIIISFVEAQEHYSKHLKHWHLKQQLKQQPFKCKKTDGNGVQELQV
jgi:hypothetical protein